MATQQQAAPQSEAAQEQHPVVDVQKKTNFLDRVVLQTQQEQAEQLLIEQERFSQKQRLARLFAASGLFADIKGASAEESIARAFVKVELGESMGFTPAESMTGIDIIQGRVAVGANLRATRMRRAGFSWESMVLTNEGCWLPLNFGKRPLMAPRIENGQIVSKDGEVVMEPVVVSFTKGDATLAGLIGKDNYKKHPRNMYFARAVTNAQRWYAPEVLGGVDILSTEEAQDLEPERGTVKPAKIALFAAKVDAAVAAVEAIEDTTSNEEPNPEVTEPTEAELRAEQARALEAERAALETQQKPVFGGGRRK